jgi:hypothetical protein
MSSQSRFSEQVPKEPIDILYYVTIHEITDERHLIRVCKAMIGIPWHGKYPFNQVTAE